MPIVFLNPDHPAAQTALQEAIRSLPDDALLLGLIIKVEHDATGERVVNYMFTSPTSVQSLALALNMSSQSHS